MQYSFISAVLSLICCTSSIRPLLLTETIKRNLLAEVAPQLPIFVSVNGGHKQQFDIPSLENTENLQNMMQGIFGNDFVAIEMSFGGAKITPSGHATVADIGLGGEAVLQIKTITHPLILLFKMFTIEDQQIFFGFSESELIQKITTLGIDIVANELGSKRHGLIEYNGEGRGIQITLIRINKGITGPILWNYLPSSVEEIQLSQTSIPVIHFNGISSSAALSQIYIANNEHLTRIDLSGLCAVNRLQKILVSWNTQLESLNVEPLSRIESLKEILIINNKELYNLDGFNSLKQLQNLKGVTVVQNNRLARLDPNGFLTDVAVLVDRSR